MHSWGCATRDGVCANASFSQVKNKKQVTNNLCCSRETQLAAWGWQFLIPKSWRVYRSPSSDGKETRRRVWRVVGIGVGLLRHDGEVEGVALSQSMMRFWNSAVLWPRTLCSSINLISTPCGIHCAGALSAHNRVSRLQT